MKVLVIEDEKKIAAFVRKGLEAQGCVVDVAHRGDEGYTLATTRPYDVLVLDIMLPGRDGLSILRNLRDRKVPLPVLLLTARSELNERLDGLNLGADDYLTKPFFIEELVARLHAITRRASGATQSILAVADLTDARGETRWNGDRVDAARVRAPRIPDAFAGPGADARPDLRAGVEL